MPKNEVKQAEAGELADKLTDICNQPFTIISHGDYPLSAKEIIGLIKQAPAALKRVGELEKLLRIARCPNTECRDGAIPRQVADQEWEAEQCQWCYERKAALGKQGE